MPDVEVLKIQTSTSGIERSILRLARRRYSVHFFSGYIGNCNPKTLKKVVENEKVFDLECMLPSGYDGRAGQFIAGLYHRGGRG